MNVTFKRFLTRGDLPDSGGGLYNPSVFSLPDGSQALLVRREVDYTWTKPSFPTVVDLATKADITLTPTGFQDGARIEDCRAFNWGSAILVSHVDYVCVKGRVSGFVKQRLSYIADDKLVKWDDWDLPVPLRKIEKNWVLASDDAGRLFTIYSLDPLIVCRRSSDGQWIRHRTDVTTGLTEAFGKPPSNSTHLIPFDGGFLGFWHYFKPRSTYITGAYWLDADFRLAKRSDALIDGSWVQEDIFKPGVYYVSGATIKGDDLLLWAGEGDAHSSVATMSVSDLRLSLKAG